MESLKPYLNAISMTELQWLLPAALVFLSSIVTLLVANWWNDKRQEHALQHDANERSKQRIFETRRDVYLETIETHAIAMRSIYWYPKTKAYEADLTEAGSTFIRALSRASFISEPETAKLLSEFGTEFSLAMIDLMMAAGPAQNALIDLETIGKRLDVERAALETVFAHTRANGQSSPFDALLHSRLQQSADNILKAQEYWLKQHDEATARHVAGCVEFHGVSTRRLQSLWPLQAKAFAAAQTDLGLEPGNIENLDKTMAESAEKMRKIVSDAMEKLSAEHRADSP